MTEMVEESFPDDEDVGYVVITRHLVHDCDPEWVELNDPNPTTGKRRVPTFAKLQRPAPEFRLHYLQHGNDGWLSAYWVTDTITKVH